MNGRNLGAKPLIRGCISVEAGCQLGLLKMRRNRRVCGRWGCIVYEAQPVPVSCTPFVEETLVAAIPRAFRFQEMTELGKFVFSWGQDHDAGVEYIGPSDIGYRREFVGDSKEV